MARIDLLKKLSFGVQVAEDEVNEIASYFVETNQWARVAKGEIDIIRGEKGAGKSAIYSLLMTKTGTFFDQGILLVAAENPRGGTVFQGLGR
jgi:Fe-S cluster assembly ATPase SufC